MGTVKRFHSFAFLLIFLNVTLLPSGKNIEKENVINMISFLSLNISCSGRNSSHGLRPVSPAVPQKGHPVGKEHWNGGQDTCLQTPGFHSLGGPFGKSLISLLVLLALSEKYANYSSLMHQAAWRWWHKGYIKSVAAKGILCTRCIPRLLGFRSRPSVFLIRFALPSATGDAFLI